MSWLGQFLTHQQRKRQQRQRAPLPFRTVSETPTPEPGPMIRFFDEHGRTKIFRKRRTLQVTVSDVKEAIHEVKRMRLDPREPQRYSIDGDELNETGGGFLYEVLSHTTINVIQFPSRFTVELHEDADGCRTITYLDEAMREWSMEISHHCINAAWLVYKLIGTPVD